jgi:predicted Zn-dependent peptidase
MNKTAPRLTTLDNKVRVVMMPMIGLESVTVLAMVGVGSRFETKDKMGISHFLEHLPFKGTANYPTAMDVARAIDDVGGKHNAFTSKDYTGYWVKVASRHTDLALDMVSDLLLTAKLREEEIEREKGVIVEEINMYEDNPQFKVSNLFDELVFEGSGLAWDTAGIAKTVTGMTRDDFKKHWDTWYDPKNTVVGIVGDESALKKLKANELEAYFSKGERRKGGGKREYGVPAQTGPRLKVFYKKTEQAHYHIGFPSIGRKDPGRYALAVLTTLMGGNSSSRLFNEIREKRGLAYYAYASSDLYDEVGSFYSLAGVTVSKIEEAIKVTLGEFERAKSGDIPADEVARAKEYLIGKMSLDIEDSSSMANMMVRKLLLDNELMSPSEVLEKIKAVNVDEVKAMAKRVIDFSKVNLAVVGPYKKREEFEKLVG